jgi:hypothetical protein
MGGLGCWWSLYMLVQRARHHGLKNYTEITMKAGGPVLTKVLEISILFYMFATCLACFIVCKKSRTLNLSLVTQLFIRILNEFGIPESETGPVNVAGSKDKIVPYKLVEVIIVTFLILFPLGL